MVDRFPEFAGRPDWMNDAILDAALDDEHALEIDEMGLPQFDEWETFELHHGDNPNADWEGTLTDTDGNIYEFNWGQDWLDAWWWHSFATYLDDVEAIYEDEY